MATEFKVRDETIEAVITYVKNQAERYEEALGSYLSILECISAEGIREGATAEALQEFISRLRDCMDGIPESSRDATNKLKLFLFDVDEADQYLY